MAPLINTQAGVMHVKRQTSSKPLTDLFLPLFPPSEKSSRDRNHRGENLRDGDSHRGNSHDGSGGGRFRDGKNGGNQNPDGNTQSGIQVSSNGGTQTTDSTPNGEGADNQGSLEGSGSGSNEGNDSSSDDTENGSSSSSTSVPSINEVEPSASPPLTLVFATTTSSPQTALLSTSVDSALVSETPTSLVSFPTDSSTETPLPAASSNASGSVPTVNSALSNRSPSAGVIAGAVIGSLVFLALLIAGLIFVVRARRKKLRVAPSSEFRGRTSDPPPFPVAFRSASPLTSPSSVNLMQPPSRSSPLREEALPAFSPGNYGYTAAQEKKYNSRQYDQNMGDLL